MDSLSFQLSLLVNVILLVCSDLSVFFYFLLFGCDFKKYFNFQQLKLNRFQCFRVQYAKVITSKIWAFSSRSSFLI